MNREASDNCIFFNDIWNVLSCPGFEILINTYISVFGFYGYIENIEKISIDIWHKYWWGENYLKFMGMLGKKTPKNYQISKNTHVKVSL